MFELTVPDLYQIIKACSLLFGLLFLLTYAMTLQVLAWLSLLRRKAFAEKGYSEKKSIEMQLGLVWVVIYGTVKVHKDRGAQ